MKEGLPKNLSEADLKELCEREKTFVTPKDDLRIIELLNERNGIPTNVHLVDGVVRHVIDIGWGYDQDDPYAHVSTNVSPGVEDTESFPFDFFFTYSVAKITDPESGETLLQIDQNAR